MKHKQQNITITLRPEDSSQSLAVITIIDHRGRKARGWLSARIGYDGRARLAISILGKTKEGDRSKELVAPFHADLDHPKDSVTP